MTHDDPGHEPRERPRRGAIAAEAWRDLGGAPELLGRIEPIAPEVALPSRLDVVGLAGDGVAVATLATHVVLRDRGLAADVPAVRVDGARLATSIQSERHLRIDGATPDAWAPLSGFWEAADGWIRTHGNYPHHAARLRGLLGVGPEATKDEIAGAMRGRAAQEVEDEAARVGAIAVRVRAEAEWSQHPQAQVVAEMPLVAVEARGAAAPRRWSPDPARPLDGIRVLDLTRVIAGPIGARDLAFAGAEVLRIDAPQLPEIAWQHLDTGQGKRSARLDLTDRGDAATFRELLAQADVLVTGYRPGALEALGLAPDRLLEAFPGLVIGHVSAWGTQGPWSHRRGFDSIVQAVSGIALIESDDGVRPGALPAQALDHTAGHLLAAGLVHALADQRRQGGGRVVGVALARVAKALLDSPRMAAKASAEIPAPTLQRGTTDGAELVTALPVLGYAGAPTAYPEIGRPWAADPPVWWGAGSVTSR